MHISNLTKILTLVSTGAVLLAMVGCGEDKGSNPSDSSSSGLASSSSYVPPVSDSTSGLVIEGFVVAIEGWTAYLDGLVYVDDAKDTSAVVIDSITFGVNPAGPVVTTTGTAAGKNEVGLGASGLNATIALNDFTSCGEYTVYLTGYAKGKPVTASATFTKPITYCPSSSSEQVSSSSIVTQTLVDTSYQMAAQKRGGTHGIDLDNGALYTTVAEMEANKNTIDIIFGSDGTFGYLMSPKGVADIAEYASVAVGTTYTGSLYESSLTIDQSLINNSSQLAFSAADKSDKIQLQTNAYVVVTTDLYNATTKAGLFLVQVQGTSLGATNSASPVRVWSVKP